LAVIAISFDSVALTSEGTRRSASPMSIGHRLDQPRFPVIGSKVANLLVSAFTDVG
jgi:hypothetical protein